MQLNHTNTTATNTATYYANVSFVKGGRWLQARNATPVRSYGRTWITEVGGETLLAHSLKEIDAAITAITGGM